MRRLLLLGLLALLFFLLAADPWKAQKEALRQNREREELILKLTKKT